MQSGNPKPSNINRKGSGISLKLDRNAIDKLVVSLNVLQRWDASIEEILGDATHVVMYVYNASSTQWERKQVEGSFFVVRRREGSVPRHRLVVLNRLSLENLGHDLTGDFRIDAKPPYLIYRHQGYQQPTEEIYGVWFHDEAERRAMHELIMRVLNSEFGTGVPPVGRAVGAGKTQKMKGQSPRSWSCDSPPARERKLPSPSAKQARKNLIPDGSTVAKQEYLRTLLQVSPEPPDRSQSRRRTPVLLNTPLPPPASRVAPAPAPAPQNWNQNQKSLLKSNGQRTKTPPPGAAALLIQQCLGLDFQESSTEKDAGVQSKFNQLTVNEERRPNPTRFAEIQSSSHDRKFSAHKSQTCNTDNELLTPDVLLKGRGTAPLLCENSQNIQNNEEVFVKLPSNSDTAKNPSSEDYDRETFKKVILDLVEKDDDFVDIIYKHYLKRIGSLRH